ncbi:MAG: tetratricopeptide repeat protein [Anaerolineae bacterium]|nr:tetratricopeptide repeat protein [Anaerolineae bacterium]
MAENKSGETLKAEGLRFFEEGLYEEAIERFGQAQELYVAEGKEADAAEMLNNLGVVYRLLRRWDDAQAALEEAKAAFARLGDRNREAQALGNLGGLLASKGERVRAQEYLQQAADIFHEIDQEQKYGETLVALGSQMWKAGDRRGGMATYESGVMLLEKPTVQQKAIRSLLKLRNRLLGGGGGGQAELPEEEEAGEE